MVELDRADRYVFVAEKTAVDAGSCRLWLGVALAGGDNKAPDVGAVELADVESRRALAGAVPENPGQQTGDVIRNAGRSVDSADRPFSDSRANEGEQSRYMVRVRVRDQNIRDLMSNARRQLLSLAKIDHEAAFLMSKPDMQQRIPEHSIGQHREIRTDSNDRTRSSRKFRNWRRHY